MDGLQGFNVRVAVQGGESAGERGPLVALGEVSREPVGDGFQQRYDGCGGLGDDLMGEACGEGVLGHEVGNGFQGMLAGFKHLGVDHFFAGEEVLDLAVDVEFIADFEEVFEPGAVLEEDKFDDARFILKGDAGGAAGKAGRDFGLDDSTGDGAAFVVVGGLNGFDVAAVLHAGGEVKEEVDMAGADQFAQAGDEGGGHAFYPRKGLKQRARGGDCAWLGLCFGHGQAIYYGMSVDFALVKKEIHFRARRGLKETDLLFGRFIAAHLDDLSDSQLIEFRNLLLEFDQDLLHWFIEKELPESRRTSLTEMLLGFAMELHRHA